MAAQTWQTVLDYQFVSGYISDGWSIAADTVGNVFTGGDGWYPVGTGWGWDGVVLRTDTTGTTWQFSDDTNPSSSLYRSEIFGVGVDSSDNAYSVGCFGPIDSRKSSLPSGSLVRKSSDHGNG